MKVDGGCHCGNIRYEAEVDPAKVVICHCTDCQTLSGMAFRTVVPTSEGTFKLLAGTPKAYVKTGESGNKRVQTFCADCGSPIYSAAGPGRQVVGLRVGTIRQRDQLMPGDQYRFRSALAWLRDLPGVAKRTSNPCSIPRAASAAESPVHFICRPHAAQGSMRAGGLPILQANTHVLERRTKKKKKKMGRPRAHQPCAACGRQMDCDG